MKRSTRYPFPLHQDHNLETPAESKGNASCGHGASDLKRRVINFLATRNRPALRQLEIEVQDGVVMMRGRVRSFYDKQLAHHCCGRVAGVRQVIDGIDVVPGVPAGA